MPKVKIDRTDLGLAFGLNEADVTAYLDCETGAVVYVEEYVLHQVDDLVLDAETLEEVLAAIQAKPDLHDHERQQFIETAQVGWDNQERYRPIPRQDSREGYEDMEDFISTLEDARLRELLETAIQGRGAFRRFKDTLQRYPKVQESWFAFQDKREKQRILEWLTDEGIEAEFKIARPGKSAGEGRRSVTKMITSGKIRNRI